MKAFASVYPANPVHQTDKADVETYQWFLKPGALKKHHEGQLTVNIFNQAHVESSIILRLT